MSRFARRGRVFFIEEPIFGDGPSELKTNVCEKTGVHVVTPHLPHGLEQITIPATQRELLGDVLRAQEISKYVSWYYTPMAMEFTSLLDPLMTVYDCMDELSAFAGAPAAMRSNEEALFRQADLVFTGGATLYEAKKQQHAAVFLFPSSIDASHFSSARNSRTAPGDQRNIGQPRIGYSGVIDERMDLQLLQQAASLKPEWQFVMLGPVVKIDPATLPKAANIHYLGMKSYDELPDYLSGWRIGMLPFALNESTRYISPTKTPEYLAAGLRIISTPIQDVVTPYGDLGLAAIVRNAEQFVSAGEALLSAGGDGEFRQGADAFLAKSSWDRTWSGMDLLMEQRLESSEAGSIPVGHSRESTLAAPEKG